MRPVEAVIFDYGGVFSCPLFRGLDAFEDAMGYRRGSLLTLLFGDTTYVGGGSFGGGDPVDGALDATAPGEVADFHRLERGEIGLDDYVDNLVVRAPAILGQSLDLGAYQRFMAEMPFGVHWPIVHGARSLKDRGLELAMLTNNVREFGDTWRASFPVDELFTVVVDSSAVGMRKPEPEIYLLTCEQTAVAPEAAVFVDDNADNCAAADNLGIEAIRFSDPWTTMAELEALLERRGIQPRP